MAKLQQFSIHPPRFLKSAKYLSWCTVVFSFLFIQACNPIKTSTLPSSTGKQGELIVSLYDRFMGTAIETSIRSILGDEHPALPQPEPMFNHSIVSKSAFTGLLKAHQCIMMVEATQELKENLSIQKNVWAKPQIVIQVSGKDSKEIEAILYKNKARIQEAFLSFELNQLTKKHRVALDKNLQQTIANNFGVKLDIPKGFSLANKQENFAWIREETPETTLGILLYSFDYSDSTELTAKSIVDTRNRIAKQYVPGPKEGSYMSTMQELPVLDKEIYVLGRPAIELRGLWNVKGDFMGGPFVSYTMLDTTSNRLLYLEGFVYAPKYNKRNYIKRLEAILLSLQYK